MLVSRIIVLFLAITLCGCGLYDALTHAGEENNGTDAGVGDADGGSDTNGNGSTTDECGECEVMCVDGECVEAVSLSAGGFHTCAIVDDGRLACWGSNQERQLGRSDGSSQGEPAFVDGLESVEEVSAGWWYTCAIANSDQLRCWGHNAEGQLGIGSSGEPIVQPQSVSGVNSAQQVAAGHSHGCAVHDGGAVSCWGAAYDGQLGHGESGTDVGLSPQSVEGIDGSSTVTDLSAGWSFSAAIVSGELRMWGDNEYQKLGRPGDEYEPTPVVAEVHDGVPTFVSAGWHHSCAVFDGEEVRCWGSNESGQLGHDSSDSEEFVVDLPVHSSVEVDAGWGAHSCAMSNLGLYCWGNNDSGQLGGGGGLDEVVRQAVEVFDEPMADVAVGHSHSCGLKESGEVYCWGSNSQGQLGVGESQGDSAEPLPVGAP